MIEHEKYELLPETPNGKASVTINFTRRFLNVSNMLRFTTYCTISVVENKKFSHYHGASVWNNRDEFSVHAGDFWAFKEALRKRFDALQQNDFSWKEYRRHWCKVLWELKNGRILDTDQIRFG